MKNKLFKAIVIFIVSIFTCSSCDYLDKQPDDQLTLEMVFDNKKNVDSWLAFMYSAILDPYNYDTFEPMGDDFAPSPRWDQFGFDVINYQVGNWNADSKFKGDWWNRFPKRMRSAYILIDRIQALPEQGLSSKEVAYRKAEAKFLIAYYHSILLKLHGGIPIIDKAAPDDKDESVMLKQEPFDDVVNWIEQQLLEAAAELPASYVDPIKYGRATSVMCYAVRANLLLFAASPLVNGNAEMSSMVNSEGTPIFNSSYDPEKWKRAADANKELINFAEENGHKLYVERLSDGTIDPFMSYLNVMMKRSDEGNTEILMARTNCSYDSWDYVAQPRSSGGSGAVGITQSLVDAFFMKDGQSPILGYEGGNGGKPIINPNSSYTERGFTTQDELRKTRWQESKGTSAKEENPVALAGTYNMYANREPRFYVSVLYNDAWYKGFNKPVNFYFNGPDGGPTHDAPQNGYLVRKKVDPDMNPITWTSKIRSGILHRITESYLNYAEALNEYNYASNKQTIVGYLNLIRERAGIPGYVDGTALPVPSTQEAMREALKQERHVELNCESGIRFDDIRRWKEGHRINGDFWGMNFNGTQKDDDPNNPEAYFVRSVYQKRIFKSYWLPIPQSEIEKNPKLRQMPGW